MISTRMDSLRLTPGTLPGGSATASKAAKPNATKPTVPLLTPETVAPAQGGLGTATPYFSNASTRARLDGFFNLDGTAKVPERFIVFDFAPAPDAVTDTPRTSLLLERTSRKVSAKAPVKPITKSEGETDLLATGSTEESTAGSTDKPATAKAKWVSLPGFTLTRLNYQPVENPKVMEEALKLGAKALIVPKEPGTPNAMARPDGTLILKPQFEAEGVKEVVRPWAQSLTQAVGPWLNLFPSLKQYVSLQADGTVTLLQKFRFNPVRHWQDKAGVRLTPYRLVKLPNGVIVDEKSREVLSKTDGDAKPLNRRLKDRVLAEITAVEQSGFLLRPLPLASPQALTVADVKAAEQAAKATEAAGHITANPFAQV